MGIIGKPAREDTDNLMMRAAQRIKQLERELQQAREAHSLSEKEGMRLRKALAVAEARLSSTDAMREAENLFALVWPYTGDDLKKRYMSLMRRVHPDVAGQNGVAQRLNTGRDTIIKRRGWAVEVS